MNALDLAKQRVDTLVKTKIQDGEIFMWSEFLDKVLKHMRQGDFANFCTWPVIGLTMFCIPVEEVLRYLQQSSDWPTWKKVLNEEQIGNPPSYGLLEGSSGNLILHVYHAAKFLEKTNCKLSELEEIVEFGGGYGSLCRVFYKLGFKGRYVIYDFLEFNILQEYFLSQVENTPKIYYNKPAFDNSIILLNNLDDFSKQMENHTNNGAFVATWSISETEMSFRERFFKLLPEMQYYLLGYRDLIENLDNISFFKEFLLNKPNYNWSDWQIDFFKHTHERYLMGSKL